MARIHRSPYPPVDVPDVSLGEYVLAGADARGRHPALIDGATGEEISFGDLVDQVRSLAAGLLASGIGRGDVVALVSHNQPRYAVAFHAVLAAGATVTPMSPLATEEEMARQLRASGAVLAFASAAAAPTLHGAARSSVPLDVVVLEEAAFDESVADGERALATGARLPRVGNDGVALLPYSSGTGGTPKGVMLTHRNLVAALAQHAPLYRLTNDDVCAAVLPYYHIYGTTMILNYALRAGATQVTLPRFDLSGYLGLVERHRVSRGHFAPPLVLALANAPEVDAHDLSSLRLAMCGAAPLDVAVAARATARTGAPIGQGYGMTEASPGLTFVADEEVGVLSSGCVGRLVPNTEARLVDPATGEDSESEGEMWARGPQVMAGYLGNPTATAETLVEDGWLRTGDILRVDADGVWWVVDRLKELIKYKGYQVAPAELEALLLTHPDVEDAAVIGVPHAEGGEAPKAFVVGTPTEAELLSWVAERVAPYKRIRAVEFVDTIPKSPAGKILRRVLRNS
ncbi:AMP-binding protein [Cryptosporangium aurantiacum]|uniref:Acyl-CoA synthetase (AMP-forming)/AMP-acid ligase II n=1 Tax=Cryptosporangium aurantiacum TaxID=134849 RepID=A0A1M7QSG9_9ACTN|nr:AMP-binding protein [Cryptosporangium aurantiacum]SHN34707.1 Acyl-CoA synthetase (AMP-forming)/AMP-acid ligase II [Cryptosporangium aurantiacum]